jgi:hypothetical protein
MAGKRGFRVRPAKKSGSGATTPDDLDEKESVHNLAWWAFQAIRIIGGILLVFFGWLQLRFVPILTYVQNTPPEALVKAALIIYYASWITGATFDTRIQDKVYISDPKRGEITLNLIAAIVGFFVVAFALVWASSHQQYFAVVLLSFVVLNITGWALIIARVKPIIEATRSNFLVRDNFFRIEQLRLIEEHMTGKWQIHRFAAMLAVVLVAILIYYSSATRFFLARLIESSPIGLPSNTVAELLPATMYLTFVVMAESWIWIKRENVRSTLFALDRLRKRYLLSPLSEHTGE